jgi:hypothetical protein
MTTAYIQIIMIVYNILMHVLLRIVAELRHICNI